MRKFIYALVDPRDRIVRYVGRTYHPWQRFFSHRSGCDERNNRRMHDWIEGLRARGKRPRFIILQSCSLRQSPAAEARWIRFFRMWGKLFNGPSRVRISYNSTDRYWR